ncbi:serine/threonine-protein kinase ial-related [Anaeramoeba flamelloides]|uniref:Aurora kinase n=1 Tax=Anaeramoeba flamelloides TaxID=1746091 RepID=A0AAV8A9F6_9EUKA|nr:serine/threonine-protein kinase ial-related [Anaeramoeba flamelloides]
MNNNNNNNNNNNSNNNNNNKNNILSKQSKNKNITNKNKLVKTKKKITKANQKQNKLKKQKQSNFIKNKKKYQNKEINNNNKNKNNNIHINHKTDNFEQILIRPKLFKHENIINIEKIGNKNKNILEIEIAKNIKKNKNIKRKRKRKRKRIKKRLNSSEIKRKRTNKTPIKIAKTEFSFSSISTNESNQNIFNSMNNNTKNYFLNNFNHLNNNHNYKSNRHHHRRRCHHHNNNHNNNNNNVNNNNNNSNNNNIGNNNNLKNKHDKYKYQYLKFKHYKNHTKINSSYLKNDRDLTFDSISLLDLQKNWKRQDFDIGKKIGEGKLGSIYLARERKSNRLIALKVLPKGLLNSKKGKELLKREIRIQKKLKHPNILRMYGYFQSTNKIYLVLEYAPRGNVYRHLMKEKQFDERTAASYFLSVASALNYCHLNNIIHRDIKPENLLIGRDGILKITDFGSSAFLKYDLYNNSINSQYANETEARRKTFIGTLDYISPEMLKGVGYNHTIDIWALGILLYELLVGKPPFKTDGKIETFRKIQTERAIFPRFVSPHAKDLIIRLLQKNPQKRMKLRDIFQHPWIIKNIKKNQIQTFKLYAGIN